MFNELVKTEIPYQTSLPENNSITDNIEKKEEAICNEEAEMELKKKADKALKKKNERIQVLNELITTEKEFFFELNLCYNTFMIETPENVKLNPFPLNKISLNIYAFFFI